MATKLYVGNLSFQTQEDDLREHFAQFGEVVSATIVSDRDTGRSRGFGFVEMSSDADARSAIQALDGKELDGRQLKVNEAKPREDRRDNRSRDRY
jgi:cold-inducible RNA-binding protein